MSLTAGTGPFGKEPQGRFNFEPDPPGAAIFWEPVPYRVRAIVDDVAGVDSRRAFFLHETGHLPVYYFPPDDVRTDLLVPSPTVTHCPYKGHATYETLQLGGRTVDDLVWAYRGPLDPVSFISNYRALYWRTVDTWLVEDAIAIARKMMGATFGSKAEPGTIRGDFGVSNSFNLIHGSDSPESAQRELGLFFKPEELAQWQPAVQPWVYDLSKGSPE